MFGFHLFIYLFFEGVSRMLYVEIYGDIHTSGPVPPLGRATLPA